MSNASEAPPNSGTEADRAANALEPQGVAADDLSVRLRRTSGARS